MKEKDSGQRNGGQSSEVFLFEQPGRSRLETFSKRLVQALSTILILPHLVAYQVTQRVVGKERAFAAASESISRVPGLRGVYCRQAFYRYTLAECGPDAYFGWQSVFSKPLAKVGTRAYIGRHCAIGWAEIGAGAMLADGVQILSGARQHGLSQQEGLWHQDERQEFRKVKIGSGAWLGTNAIIMADVGRGAVVGAGAVVNKPIPPHTLAVGVPARIVKQHSQRGIWVLIAAGSYQRIGPPLLSRCILGASPYNCALLLCRSRACATLRRFSSIMK